jgi:hypothetical protein
MKDLTTARRLAQILHAVKCKGQGYSTQTFHKVGGATGVRLYKVMLETTYYCSRTKKDLPLFSQGSNKKCMSLNVPSHYDVDNLASLIYYWVIPQSEELGIDIIQKRGRKAGISPFRKETVQTNIIEEEVKEVVVTNPLESYTDQELAAELRRRYPNIQITITL